VDSSTIELLVSRLKVALTPLHTCLRNFVSRADEGEHIHAVLAFLTREHVRPIFDCLWQLGLLGDARSLFGKLVALGQYAVGPKLDEFLAEIAEHPDCDRTAFVKDVGPLPSLQGISETQQERYRNDIVMTQVAREAVGIMEQLLQSLDRLTPTFAETSGAGHDGDNLPPFTQDLSGFVSAKKLADTLGLTEDAVQAKLRRIRTTYPDSDDFITVEEPQRGEPKYLYRAEKVIPLLKK
jgi:hypothetical protein